MNNTKPIGLVISYKQFSENTTVRALLHTDVQHDIVRVGSPVEIGVGDSGWRYLGVVTRQLTGDQLSSREEYLPQLAQYG
ncbi:MAG: hypothetical protein ACP5IE_10185, partial [Infirmifilum sp.]